ncbi:phage tail spike protein [Terribacillus saccharophilus]|uniref:phage tail spike protein n=1 Tax=Terribacillus saccharophilus TaxID=361277 RepID=UPI002DC95DF8|nr:phage tail spike protein [Terribacillus saccharophilus]MEC0288803.1 phage tail spike protein [Terribacillus saccharophilus]
MYQVTAINEGVATVIHHPKVNKIKLPTGSIAKEINLIDSFNFQIYPGNPGYGKIRPYKTLVNVLNLKTGRYDFEGRVLQPNEEMENSGVVNAAFTCEGELGYLHDSQQKHREYRGSPTNFLQEILNYHNSQVEDYKYFRLGQVTVTDPNDYVYYYTGAEQTTFDTIKDKLLDRLGGELQIRKVDGIRYLDYLVRIGGLKKNTPIRLSKNLKSITKQVDPTSIITRLTVLGSRIQSEDDAATDASEARVTIDSVNNGLPYLDGYALIDEFGIQGGSITYDDISNPIALKSRGQLHLESQKTLLAQYTLTAVDLSLINKAIDSFEVGNSHPVFNPIMNINEDLRIIGKTIDINGPEGNDLTIGDKFKQLHQYQADAAKAARNIAQIQSQVGAQSQRIGTLSAEVKAVNESVAQINQAIIDSDLPGINQAIIDLNEAIYDLNASIEGIPLYGDATPEVSGLMPALDKAKLNLITANQLIDLDQMKILLEELQEKLHLISVLNPVNLDEMNNRIVALEGGSTDGNT